MEAKNLDPCESLEWDTAFWGFRTARIRGDLLTQERASRVDAWCRQNDISCLYFLARSDDATTTRLAEDNHFRLVDVRMTFGYRATEPIAVSQDGTGSSALVRPCRGEDVCALQSIARQIYHHTRFYFDRHFPRHLCDSLYETWIKRSYEGYADAVLVAEMDGEPTGYVSCHLDGGPRTGRIGLLGVSHHAQGHGIGQVLLLRAFEWFRAQRVREITIVTQGRNCAAQRLYHRCGFLIRTVQLWYHKWYATSD